MREHREAGPHHAARAEALFEPHAKMRRRFDERWSGLEARVERDERGAQPEGAVRPALVVVGAKVIELCLEVRERGGRRLLREETLQRLMEALHLAAGLGGIGAR